MFYFFFSSRRRHTRSLRDWSSDVCSSDLEPRRRHAQRARPPSGSHEGFGPRSEEHTSDSSHVEISYAVFCLKKKNTNSQTLPVNISNSLLAVPHRGTSIPL